MKKILIVAILFLAGLSHTNAQELGIRVGQHVAGNAAVDFVMPFKAGRLHTDASFGGGIGIEAIYDFLYGDIGSGFYYYVGAGPYVVIGDPFRLGLVAEGGVEYRFEDAPIVIGLDYRPIFQILEETGFYGDSFGFNIRYVF